MPNAKTSSDVIISSSLSSFGGRPSVGHTGRHWDRTEVLCRCHALARSDKGESALATHRRRTHPLSIPTSLRVKSLNGRPAISSKHFGRSAARRRHPRSAAMATVHSSRRVSRLSPSDGFESLSTWKNHTRDSGCAASCGRRRSLSVLAWLTDHQGACV